jgi:hypothetical protein
VAPPSVHESGVSYQWVEGKGLNDIPLAPFPDISFIKSSKNKKPFSEILKGSERGSRNVDLTRIVGKWVNEGMAYEECMYEAQRVNERNDPPLPENEVEGIVKDIFNRHYESADKNNKKKILKKKKASLTAYFKELVDVVIDENENVVFLVKRKNELHVYSEWIIHGTGYIPPERKYFPFSLGSTERVIAWYEKDSDKKLFSDLFQYYKQFSYLPDEDWLIVICFTFLTYVQDHKDIHYFPILTFFAVPERGKSRTGKAIINVAYRGVHLADFREAIIFRYSQYYKSTLFLDVKDLSKKAERNNADDILLQRFEKSATVSRVINIDWGAFRDMVHYDIFGPTIIATNTNINRILDTRCIPINMPSKPGHYKNLDRNEALEMKERLIAWRARVMDKPLPYIEEVEGLSGRFWEITKPLLQVCMLLSPDAVEDLKKVLLEIAGIKLEDKKESIEGKILLTIKNMFPEKQWVFEIQVKDLRDILNENYKYDKPLTAPYVGLKLRAIGLQKRILQGRSLIQVTKRELEELCSQYGITPEEEEEEEEEGENNTSQTEKVSPTRTPSTPDIEEPVVSGGGSSENENNSHPTTTPGNQLNNKEKVDEVGEGDSLEGGKEKEDNGKEKDAETDRKVQEALEPYKKGRKPKRTPRIEKIFSNRNLKPKV